MKKLFTVMIIFFIIIASSGCNSNTASKVPVETNTASSNETPKPKVLENQFSLAQKAAAKYLEQSSLDVITADEVYQKVVVEQDLNYFVVDLRATSVYAKGSIEGAVNIPYEFTAQENMVKKLPKDKKIVVVCYSGHKAGQTAALWGMLGYDTVTLINGMSGWNKTVSSLPSGPSNLPTVTKVFKDDKTYELPTFKEEKVADVNELFLAKSDEFIKSKKSSTLKVDKLKKAMDEDSSKYYILDVRNADDYKKGHITGAVNVPYKTIMNSLSKVPSNKPIIIAAYNGSDGSYLSRILTLLGYDAYALKFGMRAWTGDVINYTIAKDDVVNFPLKKLQYNTESNGAAVVGCG